MDRVIFRFSMCFLLLAVAAGVVAGCVCGSDAGAQDRPLKVLMIGNSFSVCCQKQLPTVAAELGLSLDLASANIGGCSLQRHWNNCTNSEAGFHPYYFSRYTCGKFMDAHFNLPMALKLEPWDVVTIQQCSEQSVNPASYQPYADNLIALIRQLAPQAKILIQETWAYGPGESRLVGWNYDQNEMYRRLHANYATLAAKHDLAVIQMGTAVQAWRRELPVRYGSANYGGDVVGKIGWKGKEDLCHLNPRGEYLQALVWAVKLFDADLSKLDYHPTCVTAAEAKLMAKIAQEVK